MEVFRASKPLNKNETILFHRLLQAHQTTIFIATLLGGLSLVVLTFDEFHSTDIREYIDYSASLLAGSAITAIFTKIVALALLFLFEGNEKPTVQDLALAWLPFVLVAFEVSQPKRERFTARPCNTVDIPNIATVVGRRHYDYLSHTSVLEIQRSHPDPGFFFNLGLITIQIEFKIVKLWQK
ncbi:reverse transcriptase [Purpureocillium lavendulum]|uniref:Reverse transcriptase n=1 Tax=Purpureocillium lavendulum TaxID=1247861 RepID=A0AB34FC03_9HYPO|nr:reverse transcriptase [Purpureocillium lavendulum]